MSAICPVCESGAFVWREGTPVCIVCENTALRADIERLQRPLPSSCPCSRCGRRDGLDAAVDDETWVRISGRTDGGGLLCLWCMDELAAEKGLESVPVRLYFAGRALFSVPVDEFTDLGWSDGEGE